MFLRDTDNPESGGSVTEKVTDADYKREDIERQRIADYSARAAIENQPQKGLFGKMFIDPIAARELPQTEGARILAMGKSGIALLGGATPEFPFAAYAQQHLPNTPPSLNTQMMEKTLGKYINEGKADPRVENSLHKMVNDDLLPDAYSLAQKYPADYANILNGFVRTPEQEKDYLKFKDKADAIQTLRDNSLLLPEFLKKLDDDNNKRGLVVSPETQKAISDYYQFMDNTIGKANMEEQSIGEQKKLLNQLHGYAALDEMIKKVLPEKGAVLKGTDVAPATYTDKNGKQVPIANTFAENNYENPETQAMKDDLVKRADLIIGGANDDEKSAIAKQLGSKKDDESLRNGLVNYMYSILPKGGNTTLHSEGKTVVNVNTGTTQTGTVYKAEGEETTFGEGSNAVKQAATSSYGLTPFTADLGTQANVISQKTGESESVDLNGVKIGNIQNRRVKVVNGKIKPTNETGSDTFIAPLAIAEKTVTEQKYKRDSHGNIITDPHTKQPIPEGEAKTGTENFFIPLSYIANIKTTDDNTVLIDNMYKEALDANKVDANKEANDQFQKYFGMTKIDIYKQKKTGAKSTKTSVTNPAYNY